MSQKLIVIAGVTGTQGGSVARHFLPHKDWRIRGITRNPDSPKAKQLAEQGVELAQGDYDDTQSLRKAFEGAHAIFAVTDYTSVWTRVSESEDLKKKAAEQGLTINEYARELEIKQGLGLVSAASDPAVLSGLEHFVWSTLTAIKKISGGRYTNACQFDSKAAVEDHIRENVPELSKRMSTVNMGAYQENVRDQPIFAPYKEADGSGYYFVKLKSSGQHKTVPELWSTQDSGVFVEALVRHHPPGTDVLGASEILTKDEYAEKWGRVLGVKASAKALTEEELKPLLPEGFEDEVYEWFHFVPEYGYTGGNPKVKTPQELGIKTTPLERFFESEDWSQYL
ncbi:hypothetical protein CKM354_000098200 [Cercospora kikuchii]|uniref:NmrA-like domain-containing protein n=1 Tax=Cercospora kikuchii TaxID=84275 RepID=A0A9P3CA11_9PEZI|nr:uncharacterized protein CKM354_000098200 [Cercospora kikuchii]GIZ37537.1 hypothetical protein CKM354_000098200 [Cercospora kikuchii]